MFKILFANLVENKERPIWSQYIMEVSEKKSDS